MVTFPRLTLVWTGILLVIISSVEGKGLMFPFMTNNGDTEGPRKNDETVSLPLPVEYGFYGKKYSSLNINENAVFSFDKNIFEDAQPKPFPLLHDVIIALFWADHDIAAGNKGAHIWHRNDNDDGLLTRATEDITSGFGSCAEGFKAKHLTIVTWQKVAPACMQSQDEVTNSYQLVYVSDGKSAYVYLNFQEIGWTHACSGDNHATVGFNAGPGKYFELPYSGTADVKKLAEETNVKLAGRWMYKVDGNTILDPQCNKVPTPSFHPDLQAGLNAQIHTELYASNVYLSIAMYFDRPDVDLHGFYNFFMHASVEENEHAQLMMKYMNMRGGDVISADIAAPDTDSWGSGLDAIKVALYFEMVVSNAILELHALALELGDPQFAHFLSVKFLEEQEEAVGLLKGYITQLERNGPGEGEFLFDLHVLQKSTGLSEHK